MSFWEAQTLNQSIQLLTINSRFLLCKPPSTHLSPVDLSLQRCVRQEDPALAWPPPAQPGAEQPWCPHGGQVCGLLPPLTPAIALPWVQWAEAASQLLSAPALCSASQWLHRQSPEQASTLAPQEFPGISHRCQLPELRKCPQSHWGPVQAELLHMRACMLSHFSRV